MSVTAFVALGSNLGDRQQHLDCALADLLVQPGIEVVRWSSTWETTPVGGPQGQCAYLNAVAQLQTTLSPHELLEALLQIERRRGRVRQERLDPRTLDLDLLLYAESVLHEVDFVVPHPRMHERAFVLGPLAEIAPTFLHPALKRTAVELLAELASPPIPGCFTSTGKEQRTLANLRAAVTGSSSGIGRAIALALAEHGAHVLIHARTSEAKARAVSEAIQGHEVQSDLLLADFSDLNASAIFAEQAWERFGPIDIWVNNAGADILTAANLKLSFEEKLQALLAVDVTASIQLGRIVGQRMKARGHGVIVNLGWDQAETGMAGDSGQLFGATKGAVMAFTKSLALTLAPEVRVNCVAPGWIRTAWGEKASAQWQERAVRETPLGRWGTPGDVANVVAWLVSPAAAFVTGQIVRVNGGAVR